MAIGAEAGVVLIVSAIWFNVWFAVLARMSDAIRLLHSALMEKQSNPMFLYQ